MSDHHNTRVECLFCECRLSTKLLLLLTLYYHSALCPAKYSTDILYLHSVVLLVIWKIYCRQMFCVKLMEEV